MLSCPPHNRNSAILMLTLLALTATGCSTFSNITAFPKLGEDAVASSEQPAQCTVELRHSARRTKSIQVPLSAESRVQDVLDASQASSKFRNLDVYILRPTKHPTEPALKMVCQFDRKTRRIDLQTDYAVLPGDRVIVSEARSNPMDEMLGGLIGPVLGGI